MTNYITFGSEAGCAVPSKVESPLAAKLGGTGSGLDKVKPEPVC